MLTVTNRRITVIAALLALVTAYVVWTYLARAGEPVDQPVQEPVVVAVQTIPANTQVTEGMLRLEQVPAEFVHPQAVSDLSEAVDAIAVADIFAEEQVLETRLFRGEPEARFSFRIREGDRALTLTVNEESSIAGLIDVNDRVDLLWTITEGGQAQAEQEQLNAFTVTLLQNVQVLAVGPQFIPFDDGEQHEVSSITLAVSPQDAQRVSLARQLGQFRVVLRSPLDQRILDLGPALQQELEGLGGQ